MSVPKIGDLYPDGVRIVVDWDAMEVGMSVFVPCVNTAEATKQLKKVSKTRGWTTQVQVRIEDGRFGVRMWRIL